MKRLVFVMLVLLLFGGSCFAIDFMGPPATELKEGQWTTGAFYSFSKQDLEISGNGISATDDVEASRYYVGAAVGLFDGWELNGRIGAAMVETDEFEGGTDFGWSWGTKITFASDEKIDWGVLFQMSSLTADDKLTVDLSEFGLGTNNYDVEVDAIEMQIAVGPTFKMDGYKLYGGGFLYQVEGDLDVELLGVKTSFDVEEDSMAGAYIGAQIDIAENTCFTVEVAATSDGWGVGAMIDWRF